MANTVPVVAAKPWYQSKEVWTLAATIIGTVGGVISGEQTIAALVPIIGAVAVLVMRLFFTQTNLTLTK